MVLTDAKLHVFPMPAATVLHDERCYTCGGADIAGTADLRLHGCVHTGVVS